MSAPIPSYRNTTTDLAQQPTHVDPPKFAELQKIRSDRGRTFVMGECDTAKSLFERVYPESLTDAGRDLRGGASHLQAYLENLKGGYPKPGDVVNLPPFFDFAGKMKPEQLQRINERMATEQPRCLEARIKEEKSSRQSDGATRMASAMRAPSMTKAIAVNISGRSNFVVATSMRQAIPAPVRTRA